MRSTSVFIEVKAGLKQLKFILLLPLLHNATVESDCVAQEKQDNVHEQSIQLDELKGDIEPGRYVPVAIVQLLAVEVFRSNIDPVIWMEPLRLLITSPLRMIEVLLSAWLIILPLSGSVLIYRLLPSPIILINAILDVIRLSTDRIREHLICLVYFLEHLCGLLLVLTLARVEVRMILLGHLVVGEFDFFGGSRRLDSQSRVQIVFISLKVEYDAPALESRQSLIEEYSTFLGQFLL